METCSGARQGKRWPPACPSILYFSATITPRVILAFRRELTLNIQVVGITSSNVAVGYLDPIGSSYPVLASDRTPRGTFLLAVWYCSNPVVSPLTFLPSIFCF